MEYSAMNKRTIKDFKKAFDFIEKTKTEIDKVIIGQQKVKDLILISILSKGHSILTGVPGLAKTMLIRNLARIFNVEFSRIQFTPDLMPSDIIGSEIIDMDEEKKKHFKFHRGPIFANLVLADEINRTPPKTQSALLQAMEEKKVTVAGNTYVLPDPFFVFATQNPIEQEGTYPLPEAELDRFLFNIEMDYPGNEDEYIIASKYPNMENVDLSYSVQGKDIIDFTALIEHIEISDQLIKRIVKTVKNTRPVASELDIVKQMVLWGAGPRASQYLMHSAKANAVLKGHTVVSDADVQELLMPVLKHRIILNFNAQAEGVSKEDIIKELF